MAKNLKIKKEDGKEKIVIPNAELSKNDSGKGFFSKLRSVVRHRLFKAMILLLLLVVLALSVFRVPYFGEGIDAIFFSFLFGWFRFFFYALLAYIIVSEIFKNRRYKSFFSRKNIIGVLLIVCGVLLIASSINYLINNPKLL